METCHSFYVIYLLTFIAIVSLTTGLPSNESNKNETMYDNETSDLYNGTYANSTEFYNETMTTDVPSYNETSNNTTEVINNSTTPSGNTTEPTKINSTTTTIRPGTSSTVHSASTGSIITPFTPQQFHVASFIGGIILCAGVAGMIYVGCRYYSSRAERDYHQL